VDSVSQIAVGESVAVARLERVGDHVADLAFLPYRVVTQSGTFNWCALHELPVLASDEGPVARCAIDYLRFPITAVACSWLILADPAGSHRNRPTGWRDRRRGHS
jgi:hypothetical protein